MLADVLTKARERAISEIDERAETVEGPGPYGRRRPVESEQ
jgi:hypothetical protein